VEQLTAGIVIFDDVEVLDVCGPFEVFSVARLLGSEAAAYTARRMEYPWSQ
jgi:hypothetical protein